MTRDTKNWTFIDRICRHCNAPFKAVPSDIRRGFGLYCSLACARAPRQTIEQRFLKYVSKTPEANGCRLWTGATVGGYGMLTLGGRTGKREYAHRIAFSRANPSIPIEGKEVCHKCDNPPCINPEHLFVGTHTDNMRDAGRKGRCRGNGLRGERHPKAKLSDSDVAAIRERYSTGTIFQRELGQQYGVNQTTISLIVLNKSRRQTAA